MATESLSAEALLLSVRQRVSDGRLPMLRPDRVMAGYGRGTERCCVCDRAFESADVSYELPAEPPGLKFHVSCYNVWQSECGAIDALPDPVLAA